MKFNFYSISTTPTTPTLVNVIQEIIFPYATHITIVLVLVPLWIMVLVTKCNILTVPKNDPYKIFYTK